MIRLGGRVVCDAAHAVHVGEVMISAYPKTPDYAGVVIRLNRQSVRVQPDRDHPLAHYGEIVCAYEHVREERP